MKKTTQMNETERNALHEWVADGNSVHENTCNAEDLFQKEVGDHACVEVIDYNRKNEQREHSNEVHQKERQQERELHPTRKHSSMER